MAVATVSARPKMYSERKTQIEYEEAYSKYNRVYEKYEKAYDAYKTAYDKYVEACKKYEEYLPVYEADTKNPTVVRKMSVYYKSYKFCKDDLTRKEYALEKAQKKLDKAKQVFDEKNAALKVNKEK